MKKNGDVVQYDPNTNTETVTIENPATTRYSFHVQDGRVAAFVLCPGISKRRSDLNLMAHDFCRQCFCWVAYLDLF